MQKQFSLPKISVAIFCSLLALFFVIFAVALSSAYTQRLNDYESQLNSGYCEEPSYYFEYETDLMTGYGEKERVVRNHMTGEALPRRQNGAVIHQKYAKIAMCGRATENFDADETAARKLIAENGAVIQKESSLGDPGSLEIRMQLAVAPKQLETLTKALQKLGHNGQDDVYIIDTTTEYRGYLNQQYILELELESLKALRAQSESVADRISLEQEIIKYDMALQKRVVTLEEYAPENAMCTIKFTLREQQEESYEIYTPEKPRIETWHVTEAAGAAGLITGLIAAGLLVLLLVSFAPVALAALYKKRFTKTKETGDAQN